MTAVRTRVLNLPRKAVGTVASKVRNRVDPLIFPDSDGADDQWQRVVMNREIKAHLRSLGPRDLDAAEISGDAQKKFSWKSFTSLNYPEFDLCAPITAEERFDVVICEQVLEHVIDPFLAVDHLFELTRPGGHLVVSTPFLIKQHELPLFAMFDYWRFTPRGLKLMLERSGFEVDHVTSWGNRLGVIGNLDRWSAYRRWLPLQNRRDLAVVVWAYAHRPLESSDG
ncbi:MAG: class I SAM-dependent methyltransferase [Acidimicrobiales bacterium]|nr:class I SAM-dependent methyltransferase [Acidimicrobiales bacterium]